MATLKATTFDEMLNEYLVYSNILEESFRDQNWLLKTSNIIKTWQGGNLIVPFQQSLPSSVKMGGLTAEADIDEATYVRGKLTGYKEIYGALVFNSRDLFLDHGKISEQNFLKILPNQIEQLMKFMKQTTSIQILNGGNIDDVRAGYAGANDGLLTTKHPERMNIGLKIHIADGDTSGDFYITKIDKNTGILTVSLTRGGAAADMTGYDATTKIYIDNGQNEAFGSLRDMLLPASAGGSDNFAGKVKADSPFAQSVLYDAGGAGGTGDWGTATAVTGAQLLALVFDALRKGHQLAAEPECFVMSYLNFSACLLGLELNSGAFKNVKERVDYAGYSTVTIGGLHGSVELVGIREQADDWIAGVKKSHLDFHCGEKMFSVLTSPDGLKYYTVRNTTGYRYITDIVCNGDFIYSNPWSAVAIHNIPVINLPSMV